MSEATSFLKDLREEVERHPAVNHPFLKEMAQQGFSLEQARKFGLQHYALVGQFTTYLELLLLRAPSSETKLWLAKVLVDEYGEGSEGKDHAHLYREFLSHCGVESEQEFETNIHPGVMSFIKEHLRICREEPFLVGLGAVGPGHEWAIPKMFPYLVKALQPTMLRKEDYLYFDLHLEQDIDHGLWLEEALLRFATDREAMAQIRGGTMLSLEARARFWDAVSEKVSERTVDAEMKYSEWIKLVPSLKFQDLRI